MNGTYIINGQVYIDHTFQKKTIYIQDGTINLLEADCQTSGTVFDAAGRRIVPGFIDIHTHGAVGVDVNGASAEDLEKIGKFFAKNGTTSWLASILTDTEEQTSRAISQCIEYQASAGKGAQLLGIHLEGPFLASEFKGAMPEHLLKKGSADLAASYQRQANGNIRYITVSPEVEGVLELIPRLRELGIVVAMGHSGADYDTAMAAIQAGTAACTHTFNAMAPLHQHRPAIIGAALESDVYCEMICDGLHLHPAIVRLLWKTKGPQRLVAITDSIMAAGLPDGNYHLGVNQVVVEKGDAKLASDGTRAGSTLTQDRALRNLLSFTGLSLEEILPVLTENPAKLIGVYDRKGSIEDGKDADLVVLDEQNQVADVFLQGIRL
ncbi:MAG TPA: N-acetylglucosamine-6-phosphate deacetylase [Candidatus Oscillibacter pullicola]|nr:N-acetylglucosamine-6-phosphate deacetylase [Oscillospiraceae bacterium]HJB52467.1 N-acetylglucosamine-6-phosphate deacetylase [Candidatus Oscillibacter pullicola]